MTKEYRICTKCILDTTAPYISFDKDGVCNYCRKEGVFVKEQLSVPSQKKKEEFNKLIAEIKRCGRGKKYDCIIGLSGGVDSTYLAYIAKEVGLRPLTVHLDNGWDTEMAVENINNIVKRLGLDLYTCKVDWKEFKDLQLAYLKASVVDIEVPTDHAIKALLYRTAKERGIKYILSGGNLASEGILPKGWAYNKNDLVNLRDIHRRFGTLKLKTFPTLGFWKKVYYERVNGIQSVAILDYISYVKKNVKDFLIREIGWNDYGNKHYESIFTRFFQAYILPKKFNIDKRRAHLSSLICSGQITREEALEEIEKDPYPDKEMMKRDKEVVLRKLGLTEKEFEKIMNLPIKSHFDYRTNVRMVSFARGLYKITRLFKGFVVF